MKRYIQDDEVALILSPTSFDENGWTGDLSTGLLVGEPKLMAIEELGYLVHLATLMGAFLKMAQDDEDLYTCLLYTSPSPRDRQKSRMPSSA